MARRRDRRRRRLRKGRRQARLDALVRGLSASTGSVVEDGRGRTLVLRDRQRLVGVLSFGLGVRDNEGRWVRPLVTFEVPRESDRRS